MVPPAFNPLHGPPAPMEVRVDRDGPGRRNWRWSILRGDTLIARSPAGFAGAEEAFEAGRRALHQPRSNSEPSTPVPAPRRR